MHVGTSLSPVKLLAHHGQDPLEQKLAYLQAKTRLPGKGICSIADHCTPLDVAMH